MEPQKMKNKRNPITIRRKVFLLLSFLIPFYTMAQPNRIPLSKIELGNRKQLESCFNNDSVRLFRLGPEFKNRGIFILYEKADTLNFNNPFFKTDTPFNNLGSTSKDYILEGLAYYEKEGSFYQKRFANDEAFFCASCNNMHHHEVTIHHDTLTLSMRWGPPRHDWTDRYFFIYQPSKKRWQLIYSLSEGSNDINERIKKHEAYDQSTPAIYLNNYANKI